MTDSLPIGVAYRDQKIVKGSLDATPIGLTTPAAAKVTSLEVTEDLTVDGDVEIVGAYNVDGNFSVATNKFTVAAASGNTAVAGTLNSVGNFSVATNKFTVNAMTGEIVGSAYMRLGGDGVTGTATFIGNGQQVALKGAVSGNPTYVQHLTYNNVSRGYSGYPSGGSSEYVILNEESGTFSLGTANSNFLTVSTGLTSNFFGDVTVATNKFTVAAASGNTNVAGTLNSADNFSVATSKFTVAATSGNTVIAGSLYLGSSTINACAIAQFDSTSQGVVFPRQANPSASILNPLESVMSYDSTNHVYTFYNGTTWKVFATV